MSGVLHEQNGRARQLSQREVVRERENDVRRQPFDGGWHSHFVPMKEVEGIAVGRAGVDDLDCAISGRSLFQLRPGEEPCAIAAKCGHTLDQTAQHNKRPALSDRNSIDENSHERGDRHA